MMIRSKRSTALELLLFLVAVGCLLLLTDVADGFTNHTSEFSQEAVDALRRIRRRIQPQPQQPGYFFPIAMYTVRHHRPSSLRGRVRPETWEYRGQYFYGFKPRANSGKRQAARLLAAGLPLLLAPLLSILFSIPVVVPVAQTTTITSGGTINGPFGQAPWIGKRKRRRRQLGIPRQPNQPKDKASKMKELEVVANYLQQVDYDEKQQSRVMVNYLQCNGLLGMEDHCLERLSCEFADPANLNAPELERTVTSILLGHMLNNEFLPRPFKKRLKSAAVYGRNNSGKCNKYFCHYVDDNWDYAATYPETNVKESSHTSSSKHKPRNSVPPKIKHPATRHGLRNNIAT